ncbi:hypothetical protein [Pseudomonas viridiflava]|uniref:hypothetical protein n=1 Tax=Pseudomonas viridiflava TaxID=33069 RepID=UPI000F03C0DF|nr:hypothetical protein [Pseudomonas viridiflava]
MNTKQAKDAKALSHSTIVVLGFLTALLVLFSTLYGMYKILPLALTTSEVWEIPCRGLAVMSMMIGLHKIPEKIITMTRTIAAQFSKL